MRKTGFLRAFLTVTAVFAVIAVILFMTGVFKFSNQTPNANTTSQPHLGGAPTEVTTVKLSKQGSFYIYTTGIIDPVINVAVYPSTQGQIKISTVEEGDIVYAGEVMFVLGGINTARHPNERQLQIAQINADATKQLYGNALAAAQATLNSAELQLENVKNQTAGAKIDLQVIDVNKNTLDESIRLAKDSLDETRKQTENNRENILDSIDKLNEAKRAIEDQKQSTASAIGNTIGNTGNDTIDQGVDLATGYVEQQFDTQIKQIDSQITTLENQLESLDSGLVLAENQMFGTINQLEGQRTTLDYNEESARTKLGLIGGSSVSIETAEQAVESAKAQTASLVKQAEMQMNLAQISLASAIDLVDGLTVVAPVTGVVTQISNVIGDVVSPQVPIARVIDQSNYELNVSVDVNTSRTIPANANAEILIGGKYVGFPIKSISPVANTVTRLVNVIVALPPLHFISNETFNVRIPVTPISGNGYYLPLDAVTIGTLEKYVYVVENGKAKRVDVETGDIHGDLIVITKGITENDEVILDGAKRVTEGQDVVVVNSNNQAPESK